MKSSNSNRFYRFLEWIMWMMYLNLLWIAGVLMGLVIVGIFPATLALVVTIREWHMKDDQVKMTQTFFRAWKKHFFAANGIGIVYLLIGYILYVDFYWIVDLQSEFRNIFVVFFFVFAIMFLISLLYVFPAYAHFDTKLLKTIKNATIVGIFSPFLTILMGVILLFLYYLYNLIPGLIPVISVSVVLFSITKLALFAFSHFESKQQYLREKSEQSVKKGDHTHA